VSLRKTNELIIDSQLYRILWSCCLLHVKFVVVVVVLALSALPQLLLSLAQTTRDLRPSTRVSAYPALQLDKPCYACILQHWLSSDILYIFRLNTQRTMVTQRQRACVYGLCWMADFLDKKNANRSQTWLRGRRQPYAELISLTMNWFWQPLGPR